MLIGANREGELITIIFVVLGTEAARRMCHRDRVAKVPKNLANNIIT